MHEAWDARVNAGSEWAQLAPGVRWKLKAHDGQVQAVVQAKVAITVGHIFQGRAELFDLGFDELGELANLDTLAGLSVFAGAVYAAELLLEDWEGIVDADTGETLPVTPEAIRAALKYGPPDGGNALLAPFMAWLDKPRQPLLGDQRRLRELAKWEHSGGLKHCEGCNLAAADCARGGTDGGALCPRVEHAPRSAPGIAALAASHKAGVWQRSGMEGQVTGIDYTMALELARTEDASLDEGGFVRCLAAVENGALEAQAEAQKDS